MQELLEYAGEIFIAAWPLFLCGGVIAVPLLMWIASREDDEYDSIYDHYDLDDINDKKQD